MFFGRKNYLQFAKFSSIMTRMLSQRLRELLLKKGEKKRQLSKDLKINEGQLSSFLKKKRGIGYKKMEQIVDALGYETTLSKKGKIGRTLHKKIVLEGVKTAEIEIWRIIEEFQTNYDVYVPAIDVGISNVKIRFERGGYIPGSTKERKKPESEQEPKKGVKFDPWDRDRDSI